MNKSVDSAAKEVIEVVSSTTSNMLEKSTEDNVSGFQGKNLGRKPDIKQYKLLNIQENSLDN